MSGETVASPVQYSNAAIFASEAIATALTIYLGESIIANELLARTKGRAMGWGFVALGFGLAFGVSIFMFGYISAHLNPATCLALWILGKIDGLEFLAASGGEFVGAFFGACLVWLHFVPHFKNVPEPPPKDEGELLLRSRDAITPGGLNIASYSTHKNTMLRRKGKGVVGGALSDIKYYFNRRDYAPESHVNLVKLALGEKEMVHGGPDEAPVDGRDAVLNRLRRRTVQVCDVHRRLKDIDIESFKNMAFAVDGNGVVQIPAAEQGVQRMHSMGDVETGNGNKTSLTSAFASPAPAPEPLAEKKLPPQVEHHKKKLDQLYEAAVIADQNAKLSIFATRPAIRTPFFNFLVEFMCTTALIYGALMMYARRELLFGPERALFRSNEGMWIGFFVFVCILGLGGPTGIAANPARDLAPRFAHYLLPIPGKGPSEWDYAWIPFFAPFLGGCAAAGLYAATQLLNQSIV